MSSVNVQSTAGIIRWYTTGSYEEKSPYKAIASYFSVGDGTIYLYGMYGEITKADMAELFLNLHKNGIHTLLAERHGKLVSRNIEQLLKREKLL